MATKAIAAVAKRKTEEVGLLLDVERARAILAECVSTDEARGIKDKALAVALYLRSKRAAISARNDAQEIAARAERRMGEILATADLHKGGRPKKVKPGQAPAPVYDEKPRLADLDITRAESRKAQALAAIPEGEFAARINAIRERGDLITRQRLLATTSATDHDGDEWRTPAEYVEKARRVLGTIDLDPASNAAANKTVKATRFYTKADDALKKAWAGRVWLNPPYAQPLMGQFIDRLIAAYKNRSISSAVVLVNNATDTAWFHSLLETFPVCFTKGRISFLLPSGIKVENNRQGQAFFFLGCNIDAVLREFGDVGLVLQRVGA